MPQAATVTIKRGSHSGEYVVTVTETGGTTSDEEALVDAVSGIALPKTGRIRRVVHERTGGTAATRICAIRETTGATGARVAYLSSSTAVATIIDEQPDALYRSNGLYWFSGWVSDADNAGTTRIYITTGWGA